MPVIETLSPYIAAAAEAELPAEVVDKTKQHILDTIAAMVSGSKLKPGRLAIRYARAQRGGREAAVVGSGLKVSAVNAAMANGILAHADESDDTHWGARMHPGCAIVPAALAMAEREARDGKALIRAVALGYDIGCRLVLALGGGRQIGWHSSYGLGGTFGAAAAASALARLDARQTVWSLSFAAQQASGVLSWMTDQDHIEKAFDFGGMAARNGVTAALLVQTGFTGVADVLEGEKNFLGAYSSSPDPGKLIDGLGERFEIMATSIKRFPVGAPIQTAAAALLVLLERHKPRAEDVEKVVVRLPAYGVEVVDDRRMPDVNLQYIMAVMLLDGSLSFAAAHDARRMKDKSVRALKSRVELVADETLTKAAIPRQAIVELALRGGQVVREHVVSGRGTPENPMSFEEVRAKALDLIGPVLGTERAEGVIERIRTLEALANARELGPLLKK